MFDEDLSVFFDPAEFADAGVLAGREVSGIFHANDGAPDVGGMLVQRSGPDFLMPAAHVLDSDKGEVLVIPHGTYTVRRIETAADGLARLLLETV